MISSLLIAGNALVIYMVVWSRRMRTITNFFIANLALADFVIGMFYIPFHFQGGNSIDFFWNEKCPENWNENWNEITF